MIMARCKDVAILMHNIESFLKAKLETQQKEFEKCLPEEKDVVIWEEKMSEKQRGESIFNCGFNSCLQAIKKNIKKIK